MQARHTYPQTQHSLKSDALLGGLGLWYLHVGALQLSGLLHGPGNPFDNTSAKKAESPERMKCWLTSPNEMAGFKKDGLLAEYSFCFLFRSPNYDNLETVSINCPIRHLVITLYRNTPSNHSGKGWAHYFIVSQIKKSNLVLIKTNSS